MSAQPVPYKSKDKSPGSINRIPCAFKSEKYVEKSKVENQKNYKSSDFGILFSKIQIYQTPFPYVKLKLL